MLKVLRAELAYNLTGILTWFALVMAVALLPFSMELTPQSLRTGALLMIVYLPIATVVLTFRLLSIDRKENRLRLLAALPLSWSGIAVVRLLRPLLIPLMAGVYLMIVLAVGLATVGSGFLPSSAEPWLLVSMFVAGLIPYLLASLLHDIGGMLFSQVAIAAIAVIVLLGDMGGSGAWSDYIFDVASTPLGPVALALLCLLLAFADVVIFSRRRTNLSYSTSR